MSGHSKWSSIKHKKAATDAKRGKIFTKIIKEITVAARTGGGDLDGNARLRTAIDAAKAANMPKNNIENAIKKGTGELPGVIYEEITYEGYGPGGIAIMIEALTDNKRRTVAEIRHVLDKHGGNLGETGCVGWMFDRRGSIIVSKEGVGEDEIFDKALESGAEDVQDGDDSWEIYTSSTEIETVRGNLEVAGVTIENYELTQIPQNSIKIDGKNAMKMLKLMEAIEDNDDVQNVYANFDIADEIIDAFHSGS